MRYIKFLVSVLIVFPAVCTGVRAQSEPSQNRTAKPKIECDDAAICVDFSRKKPRKKPKKDNFGTTIIKGNIDKTFTQPVDYSILPIPTYIAEGGFGGGIQGSLLYRLDRRDSVMQPSNTTFLASLNQSLFVRVDAYGQTLFPGRKHRLLYDFQYWHRRSLNFWGISYENCAENPKMLYGNMRLAGNINYIYNITSDLFVGASVNLNYTKAHTVKGKKFNPPDMALQYAMFKNEYLAGQRDNYYTTGIGLVLQYDSRDFIPNAYKGVNIMLRPYIYPSFLGTYDKFMWKVNFVGNWYQRICRGLIFATDLYMDFNGDNTIWPLRPESGGQYRIRGYTQGRYVDNNVVAFQAELRLKLFWRIGFVAFGGASVFFPDFKGFYLDKAHILPSYGVGFRFEFKKRVNLRIDYAMGGLDPVEKNKKGAFKRQNCFIFTLNESF